jgi:hypothetical protein
MKVILCYLSIYHKNDGSSFRSQFNKIMLSVYRFSESISGTIKPNRRHLLDSVRLHMLMKTYSTFYDWDDEPYNTELIKLLIEANLLDSDSVDENGYFIIMCAAYYGYHQSISLLIRSVY